MTVREPSWPLVAAYALVLVTMLKDPAWAQTDLSRALKDHVADHWIYDDLDKGVAQAKETGKPILVVFR